MNITYPQKKTDVAEAIVDGNPIGFSIPPLEAEEFLATLLIITPSLPHNCGWMEIIANTTKTNKRITLQLVIISLSLEFIFVFSPNVFSTFLHSEYKS